MDLGMPQLDDDFSLLSDPADHPTNLSNLQKQEVIELSPFQPKLKNYPTNPEISVGKQCRFVHGWFNEFPHLEYSKKNYTVSCFVCSLFLKGPGREKASEAWVKAIPSWDRMKCGKGPTWEVVKTFFK